MKKLLICFLGLYLIGCSTAVSKEQANKSKTNEYSAPLPTEIVGLKTGLIIKHNVDTVFATINTKDPEKWGKYQLQFTTSVSTIDKEVKIIEFGGYMLKGDTWVFTSIYDRPFNSEEFEKWYKSPGSKIKIGETFSDTDNWLAKTNNLNGREIKSLWYFIGLTDDGEKLIGISEVMGILEMK